MKKLILILFLFTTSFSYAYTTVYEDDETKVVQYCLNHRVFYKVYDNWKGTVIFFQIFDRNGGSVYCEENDK